jgi:hypothetical protein
MLICNFVRFNLKKQITQTKNLTRAKMIYLYCSCKYS